MKYIALHFCSTLNIMMRIYFRSWRFNRHVGEIYFYLKFTYVVQHIVVMVGSTVVMMGFSLIGAINVVVVVKKLHLTTVHTESFDWFLSGLEWIHHLEFCLQKLLIFYQKFLLWNIRSRPNSSTFWVFEPVWSKWKLFAKINEDFDQTYVDAGSKTQNVEELSLIWYSKIISGKISKVLENKTLT